MNCGNRWSSRRRLPTCSRSSVAQPSTCRAFNTLVESASRLCEADMVGIAQPHGETFQQRAFYGFSPEYQAFMKQHPIPVGRGSIVGRVLQNGCSAQIADVFADPEYTSELKEAAKIGGARTILGLPLLREGSPIGGHRFAA